MTSASAAAGSIGMQRRGRSVTGLVLTLTLALLTLSLVATLVFLLFGGKALIVRSGSMHPTIDVGDLAMTKTVEASKVSEGDVVTFSDPTRDGILVTHRVKKMKADGARIAFVTQGDANSGVEKWLIDRNGTVGLFWFRIPRAGYAVSWAGEAQVRVILLIAGATLLAFAGLRRIWGS